MGRSGFFTLAAALTFGCGGGSGEGTPAAQIGTGGMTSPAPGSGAAPVSGGGVPVMGPAGSGGAAATGGATGAVTADPPGTVMITSGSFTVDPGGEVFKCQNFDNPFGGKDTAVSRIVSDMSPGSHHLHLYNLTEGTSRTPADCPPSDFHALVHAAGRPHQETVYPAGMATKLKGASGLRIQLHYLNSGIDALPVQAALKLSPVADPSTITKWVASIYFNRVRLSVPPGANQVVDTTCTIPSAYGPIGLVGAGSHMHRRGIHFVAKTSTGVPLIDDTTWDEPAPHGYDPPIMMNPGDSINWTCTYNNDTGMTLTFGDSAVKNEMCIFVGRYYSSSENDVQIVCQSQSNNGGVAQLQAN